MCKQEKDMIYMIEILLNCGFVRFEVFLDS